MIKIQKKNQQITMQRRQINKIVRLMDGSGSWLEEEEDIFMEFNEYYKELFRTSRVKGQGNILDYVPKLVNEDMNRSLMEEVGEDEIKKVVFQLGTYKSPCPDGFNGFFF